MYRQGQSVSTGFLQFFFDFDAMGHKLPSKVVKTCEICRKDEFDQSIWPSISIHLS